MAYLKVKMLPWRSLQEFNIGGAMKSIVIIGCGGMGREVLWLIEDINKEDKTWIIEGFLDDNKNKHGTVINGYTVLGGIDYLQGREDLYYVCAIGDPKTKKEVVNKCNSFGSKAATLIHPTVKKSSYVTIGEGVIMGINSIITVDSIIEDHVIINLNCTIAHDVHIGKYSTILSNTNISGNVNLSEGVLIGTNSAVIQGKNIGDYCIIGAGAVVILEE